MAQKKIYKTDQNKWQTTTLSHIDKCFCKSCKGSICTFWSNSTRHVQAVISVDI